MSSYRAVYEQAVEKLTLAQVPDAKVDAWYLFEHSTGLSRASYFLKAEEDMSLEQENAFQSFIEKRMQRVPVQYIIGSQDFMGFSFLVSPSTLIPRQDTEVLVEEVCRYANGKKVLDLCTGTGCIIISLAKLCESERAVGTDISVEAIETAKENAKQLEANVTFYSGDLFLALPKEEKFDIIVSNPPYIPTTVIDTLMPEVREYEPMTALDGDVDGLKFYREIIQNATKFLTSHGQLFFEIGCEQAKDVTTILLEYGFEEIRVVKDYAGLDRVVCAKRSNGLISSKGNEISYEV